MASRGRNGHAHNRLLESNDLMKKMTFDEKSSGSPVSVFRHRQKNEVALTGSERRRRRTRNRNRKCGRGVEGGKMKEVFYERWDGHWRMKGGG